MGRASHFVQVTGLCKRYGDQPALADVTFELHPNEVLGLIGPNGAGKTTLLESIAGLTPVDQGAVIWQGSGLSLADRREFIFYLPDAVRPWDDQFVFRVISFFAAVHNRSQGEIVAIVRMVGLAPVMDKRVSALSKGFARRLMLALALITPQRVLLMDEPFDGFDLRQTREIMAVLRTITARGRTLVLAIHQLLDAERVCDRLVLLVDGKVRGEGTLDELRAHIGEPTAGLEDIFLALA
jgi:ABC-2 type transport system ATP-binding protein